MSTRRRSPAETSTPLFGHPNLPLRLLQARERVLAQFRPLLHAHGLTEQQWRILRVLVEQGPLEPHQIGRLCCVSSPSLAGILARMESQALITREKRAHDHRRQLVSPTPHARSLAQRMAPDIARTYATLEATLGPSTLAALQTAIDSILAGLDEALQERASGSEQGMLQQQGREHEHGHANGAVEQPPRCRPREPRGQPAGAKAQQREPDQAGH